MQDLVKAFLIGIVLTAGFLAIPVVIAVLAPVAFFVVVIGAVWFLLQILSHDAKSDDGPDDKPP